MDNHPHTTEEYLVIACRQYAESHKDQFMPRATLWQAADTIERLQKDLGLARKQRSEFAQSGLRLEAERDAALAEVERTEHERDRSQQALHKAEHDRDSLLAEVERLKASVGHLIRHQPG